MRTLLLTALALVLGTTASHAQQETIGPHYRAYTEALERGDLITAETEAQAALAASIQRDGDGGNTGTLAFNLAVTRLRDGHGAEAVEPARKALDISTAHPGGGVDPLVARLTLGRAELAAGASGADDRLRQALEEARLRHDIDADIYLASSDLGAWSDDRRLYNQARRAWELAAERAGRGTPAADLARAFANTNAAGAIIMDGARHGLSRADTLVAATQIQAAADVYMPLVSEPAPAGGFTPTERNYARMYAWYLALQSIVGARGGTMPDVRSEWQGRWPSDAPGRPLRCSVRLVAEPPPTYPQREDTLGLLGGVVVYMDSDEAGNITRREVVASVGANFADAVRAVLPQWRLAKEPSSRPNCTMAGPNYRGVVFSIPPDN